MKKNILLLVLILLTSMLYSCAILGHTPEYGYKKDAIILHLKSDPDLNLYQKTPHTLLLCAYQLRDPNAFNQLMDEKEGMQKLMECSRFDPSVTSAKSVVVRPDQALEEKLDRADGTKYLGLIAGYYSRNKKENVTRFFQIPIGFLSGNPKRMNIYLYLGPQEIREKEKK